MSDLFDIDAATDIIGRLRFIRDADEWDDKIEDITKEAVEAAIRKAITLDRTEVALALAGLVALQGFAEKIEPVKVEAFADRLSRFLTEDLVKETK